MKSVLVIGLGCFGQHMIHRMADLGTEVMAVDISEERVDEIAPYVLSAQIGDCTKEALIASLGVRNFDSCVVAIGDNFTASLEIVSLLKDYGAKRVSARAGSDVHAKFLLRNGADYVYYPEKESATQAAVRESSDNILDFIELSPEYGMYEIAVPERWRGQSLVGLNVRSRLNVNVIAMRVGGVLQPVVDPSHRFTGDERLLVICSEKSMRVLDRE